MNIIIVDRGNLNNIEVSSYYNKGRICKVLPWFRKGMEHRFNGIIYSVDQVKIKTIVYQNSYSNTLRKTLEFTIFVENIRRIPRFYIFC